MYTTTALSTLLALAPLALSVPHYPPAANPSQNFDITVGANKELKFVPDRVTAKVGDTLTFTFFPKNHTVTSSSFANPCHPIGGDAQINSGFQPVPDTAATTGGPQKFIVTVRDDKTPLWLYCAQTTGNHCQSGMNMVVNEPKDPAKSLDAYRELAKKSGTSDVPPTMGNGVFRPNEKAGVSPVVGNTPPAKKHDDYNQKGEWKDGKWVDYQNKEEECEDGQKDGAADSSYNKDDGASSPSWQKGDTSASASTSYQGGANAYLRTRSQDSTREAIRIIAEALGEFHREQSWQATDGASAAANAM